MGWKLQKKMDEQANGQPEVNFAAVSCSSAIKPAMLLSRPAPIRETAVAVMVLLTCDRRLIRVGHYDELTYQV